MASAPSLLDEDNFLCSICLSVFTKPVSIPCGHNFCLQCITNYWDTLNAALQCPLCKEQFFTKPMLRVNTFIAEMAAKFQKSTEQKSSSITEPAGNGNVLCNICTGTKLTAFKSCLVCFMSYCETHLEPHQTISALKKHKLIPASENLDRWMCRNHDQPLELFCRVDHMFLCESCKRSDHKTHKTVTLQEEAQMRKTHLGLEEKGTDKMIQTRQQKIAEIQQLLKASKNNAEKALSGSKHVMTAMVDYIKRSQAELTEVIETKQKKHETEAEGFIKELEGEIMQIKQKNLKVSEVLLTSDPLTFLKSVLSPTIPSLRVKDWSDFSLSSSQFTIEEAMSTLETTITREIDILCDPNFKEKQQHAVDVTLDPDTAHPNIYISEDGRQAKHENGKRNVPNKPERFDNILNVLGKKGFNSGKFYYEVLVKDKTQWDLGVANQSINRKGDIRLSPRNGYWTIWLRRGNEFTANASPAVLIHVREMPQKIGVFVDYEGGQVSFYDVGARASIYSFTECKFTGKIFPFFSPCASDGGKNSAPLIITPVKNNH
ncbi:zinc-binding protein A33-like [Parambassis ranga]|uniref:Zinc-binding protein A33-like n=1 Tax=Parambassis ranga TaxID=210632 RepID=A0A6P7J7N2_9TELE|nr:zinc-binding protein A33-like [Parambassis ranga]